MFYATRPITPDWPKPGRGLALSRGQILRKGPRPSWGNAMDIIRIIVAILLPPLGVFLQEGLGKHFWINIILTLLGYLPGIVHALYIIIKR